jgi:hypothetical protein
MLADISGKKREYMKDIVNELATNRMRMVICLRFPQH